MTELKMADIYSSYLDEINALRKENKRLQEQLDIVTEQRNDIHIDKQVLQKQLNEANEVIKYLDRRIADFVGNTDDIMMGYYKRMNI